MGPLAGFRVVEFAGLGPAPFVAMLLADMGAEVLRIERFGFTDPMGQAHDVLNRGRKRLTVDLKNPASVAALLKLLKSADALLEGFRPGVMERLGLGPEPCLAANGKLVYGRMTGWGQFGPLAQRAGHDINYVSLSGALHAIGTADEPVAPLNMVGDFGGGAMLLAFGMVCALLEAGRSGKGQVVDAAMTDGAALLMTMIYSFKGNGQWSDKRADNLIDGGLPIYGCYPCADGKWLALGPLEPQFHRLMLDKMGINEAEFAKPWDRDCWPALRRRLSEVVLSKTRDAWMAIFEDLDACVSPVLDMNEAPLHPHNQARGTFITIDGVVQPAPAPRFSRTPPEVGGPPAPPGRDDTGVLLDWGFSQADIDSLKAARALS